MSYEHSQLDLHRIYAYAKRVAKETRKKLNPGFTLEWGEPKSVEVQDTKEVKQLFGLITRQETVMRREMVSNPIASIEDHWELHRRNYHVNSSRSEYSEGYYWVLLPGGELKYVWKWEEYLLEARYMKRGGSVETMSEEHILRLDRRPKSREQHHGGVHAWGDREDGPIIKHAKGVGISLALKNLLNG